MPPLVPFIDAIAKRFPERVTVRYLHSLLLSVNQPVPMQAVTSEAEPQSAKSPRYAVLLLFVTFIPRYVADVLQPKRSTLPAALMEPLPLILLLPVFVPDSPLASPPILSHWFVANFHVQVSLVLPLLSAELHSALRLPLEKYTFLVPLTLNLPLMTSAIFKPCLYIFPAA